MTSWRRGRPRPHPGDHRIPGSSSRRGHQPRGRPRCRPCRARPLQAGQQPSHGDQVVEGDVGHGPAHEADVSAEEVRRVGEVANSVGVAVGGGVFVKLDGGAVQAASMGGITQRGLVGGEGGWRRRPGRGGQSTSGTPRSGSYQVTVVPARRVTRPPVRPGRRFRLKTRNASGQLPGGSGQGRRQDATSLTEHGCVSPEDNPVWIYPPPHPHHFEEVLPGLLAATRTGLSPAGDDELTNSKIRCYVTASPPALLGARIFRASEHRMAGTAAGGCTGSTAGA